MFYFEVKAKHETNELAHLESYMYTSSDKNPPKEAIAKREQLLKELDGMGYVVSVDLVNKPKTQSLDDLFNS